MRVLLVEDVPEVRSLALQILQDAEFSVTEAVDADDAMGKLRAMTHPPDVLVTDMQMPGMNGQDLASRVRAGPPWGPRAIRVRILSRDLDAGRFGRSSRGVSPQTIQPG